MRTDETKRTEAVPLEFDFRDRHYSGEARPVTASCTEDVCYELDVILNGGHLGTVYCGRNMHWSMRGAISPEMTAKIGELILLWYE